MRRVIKPFTVEVKGAGRRSAAQTPASPQLAEQPHVEWPEIAEIGSEEPAGGMVQAIGEPSSSMPVERYLDPRKPPPPRSQPTPKAPVGRILPVIKVIPEPPAAAASEDLGKAPRSKPVPRRKLAERGEAAEPANVPPNEALPSAVDAKAVAATIVLRQGMKRLDRDAFGRGERWKARLPAAVHRASGKLPQR